VYDGKIIEFRYCNLFHSDVKWFVLVTKMLLCVRFISVVKLVTVRSHFLDKEKLCVELGIRVVFHKFTLHTCVNLLIHYHEI